MFNLNDTIEALSLFNEKAEKLKNPTFLKTMTTTKTGYTLSWNIENGLNGELRGPDQEATDAFLFSFRFFIIKNEASSFRNLAKTYESLPNLEQYKEKFVDARKYLNDFLNSTSEYQLVIDKEILTNKRIMDIVINGGLGHANDKEAVQTYRLWTQIPTIKMTIHNEFNVILIEVLRVIFYVQQVNTEILNELRKLP